MKEIPRILPEEVARRMAEGERVVFVDSRNPTAWANSDRRLPGAVRVPSDRVDQVVSQGMVPRGGLIVAYCT